MPYRRTFTRSQVHELIYESEGRRTDTGAGKATGHVLSLHADMRNDISDHRQGRIIHLGVGDPSETFTPLPASFVPPTDSRFTSRKTLIFAVHQALNSVDGQNGLGEFDTDPSKQRVALRCALNPPIGEIERYRTTTGNVEPGLTAAGVFVLLDRLNDGTLHLHTAYPTDVS